jgi:ribosomal 30S subunit maturation factor RimM
LPSSPVLEVKDGENERILIPFVNAFIAKIDKDLIIINEIEGLR